MNFIAYLQSAKQIVPAIASLDHPAPRSELRVLLPFFFFVTARLDMGDISAPHRRASQFRVIISLVAAKMLAGTFLRRWPSNDQCLQRGIEQLHIVPVSAGERDGQRDTVGVRELMPLGAQFSSICRVFSSFIPPLTGAETVALSMDWKRQSIPLRSS